MRYKLLVVALLASGCGKEYRPDTSPSPPSATTGETKVSDGQKLSPDWTHKELADYLRQKGVSVHVRSAPLFDKPDRPVAMFWMNADGGANIIVYRCADKKSATATAATLGDGAFVYERFAIGCPNQPDANDTAYLAAARNALK